MVRLSLTQRFSSYRSSTPSQQSRATSPMRSPTDGSSSLILKVTVIKVRMLFLLVPIAIPGQSQTDGMLFPLG